VLKTLPRTVTDRWHLSSLCWDGNEIGVASASHWLGADLRTLTPLSPLSHEQLELTLPLAVHRMMHIPSITYHHVEHAGASPSFPLSCSNPSS